MILTASLWPGSGAARPEPTPTDGGGALQLADLLRNAIGYVPLGACLAWSRRSAPSAVLLGSLLSAAVELAQHWIPGRIPNLVDWISNTAGTAIGVFLHRAAPAWGSPSPAYARRLAIGASAVATAILAGTGILLAPAPTDATYFGHHTPALGHLASYAGTLLDASLDGVPIPIGRIDDSHRVRAALSGNYTLKATVRAGQPPNGLAAFVMITDATYHEILLLGPDREDLVYRFRSLGESLGFEPARVRMPHALRGVEPGNVLGLRVERSGGDLCIELRGVLECGLGLTLGDGWLLLAPDALGLASLHPILNMAWMAALFLPLGYWGRKNWPSLAGCAVAATALFAVPAVTPLLSTPASQLLAAACGAGLGQVARRHFEARIGHSRRVEVG
jgi:hypothetical protein